MRVQCDKDSDGGKIGTKTTPGRVSLWSWVRSGRVPPEELISRILKYMTCGKNLGLCGGQVRVASVELVSFLRLLLLLPEVFWLQCLVARMLDSPHCSVFFPVSNKHPFVDSNLLYQFRMNFRRRRRLMELLNEKSPSQETDSPFCLRKQTHDNRKSTSFMSGMTVPLFIWSHVFCLLRSSRVITSFCEILFSSKFLCIHNQ